MSRLREAFAAAAARNEAAVVGYVMAGDPSPARSLEYARAVLRHADVLEVGVPFSDPIADGPVIERAGVRALAAGANTGDALGLVAHLRRETSKPLVLMTYYNPVWRAGLAGFAKAATDLGADGVVVPDLPLEESGPFRAACEDAALDLVQLASPASPPDRLAALASSSRGFLYVVSAYGVTGARASLASTAVPLLARAKAAAGSLPVAIGFGVSTPDHVRDLVAAGADGVVVGSAIVRLVEEGRDPDEVAAFVAGLKAAARR